MKREKGVENISVTDCHGEGGGRVENVVLQAENVTALPFQQKEYTERPKYGHAKIFCKFIYLFTKLLPSQIKITTLRSKVQKSCHSIQNVL